MSDVKRTKNSIVIGFILFFFVGALNAVKMLVLIQQAGVSNNGVYQTFAQIFSYLSVLELGLGVATVSALYVPVMEGNRLEISSILSGMKKTYFKISLITIIVAIIIIPLLLIVFRSVSFMLVLIMLASITLRIVLPYLCYDGFAMMITENKSYNVTIATSIINMLSSMTLILALFMLKNFVLAYILENIVMVFGYFIANRLFKKQYPLIFEKRALPSYPFNEKLKGSAVFKLTDTISNNTDIIVVTAVLGASYGSSYATYNATAAVLFLIVSTTVIDAIKSLLGKMYATEKENIQFNNTIKTIKSYNFLLISIVIPMLAIFLRPFTEMFFASSGTIKQSLFFVFTFCFYFYLRMTRTPYQALKVALNQYNDFKVVSILNAILNIILSVACTFFFGVVGVLLGSIVSLLLTEYWFDIWKLEIQPKRNRLKSVLAQLLFNMVFVLLISTIGIILITPYLQNLWILVIVSIPCLLLISLINYQVYRIIDPKVKVSQIIK